MDDSIKNNWPPLVRGAALQQYFPAEQGITSAHANGYTHWYIDLSSADDKLSTWNSNRIHSIKQLILRYNVLPIIHSNFQVPLASSVEELRLAGVNYIKKEIDVAMCLNSPLIVHAGCIVAPRQVKLAKRDAIHAFRRSLDDIYMYAHKRGVSIWVENLSNYKSHHPFYYVFTTDEEFKYILDSCPDVGFFFDIGHANVGSQDIVDILYKYHKRIVGISVSNNNGINDQHISMMRGTVDYKKIFEVLSSVGWSGMVAVEIRDQSPSKSRIDINNICNNMRMLNYKRQGMQQCQ